MLQQSLEPNPDRITSKFTNVYVFILIYLYICIYRSMIIERVSDYIYIYIDSVGAG